MRKKNSKIHEILYRIFWKAINSLGRLACTCFELPSDKLSIAVCNYDGADKTELHRRLEAVDYYFGPVARSPHSSGSIKSTKVRASGTRLTRGRAAKVGRKSCRRGSCGRHNEIPFNLSLWNPARDGQGWSGMVRDGREK